MSIAARDALDRRAPPWLFIAAIVTTAPHAAFLPAWVSALAALFIGWGFWLWQADRRLPSRWPLAVIVAGSCAAILAEYHTLLGRDAGVAMLVLFMAMKPLELRSRRDAMVIVTLGLFLLLTQYFHTQSIFTGLWLLLSIWLLTAIFIRINGGPASSVRASLRYAGILCLQSIPFLIALYLLFPRISGPLWGLPEDAYSGKTGLAENMSPGSIAQLVQSGEIAFRVRFDGSIPPKQKLYWRGPVLDQFDGMTWQPAQDRDPAARIDALSRPVGYETTLEPHSRTWLLALDAPTELPPDSRVSSRLIAHHRQPVTSRQRFHLTATLDYRFNVEEKPDVIARNLTLPAGFNPRARRLAAEWAADGKSPRETIDKALMLFNREFTYTLEPPLLGRDSVDEFLFVTRRGFCEHYASAFVFLMRAAGIPARVVTGYQGGEQNPLDGYLVVRQSDAHAWAEVWLTGKGWQRVDPTAAVSPSRIETGIASALPFGEPLPALVQLRADWLRSLRDRWEAVNNAWNQYLIGYDPERQRQLFSLLGFPDANWRELGTLLATVCMTLLGLLTGWALYHRPHLDPAQQLWQKALRHLARRQVNCPSWETPMALCARVSEQLPELAIPFRRVTEAYLRARYGASSNDLNALRDAVAQLKR